MEDNEQENNTDDFDIRELENCHPVCDLIYMLIVVLVISFIFLVPAIAFAYLLAQGMLELIVFM